MASEEDEYRRISAAEQDIKRRIREEGEEGWLSRRSGSPLVSEWTDALRDFEPGAELSVTDAVRCRQLLGLYRAFETELTDLSSTLDVGYIGDLSPGETVFVALVRDMQHRAGEIVNMNEEVFAALRDGDYTVARSLQPDELDQVASSENTPLEPAPKPQLADRLEQSLTQTKQAVLYGPPGTGKTFTARRFARWWLTKTTAGTPTEDQLRTVTFHPSYSYEDFIEGLTAESGGSGTVEYRIKAGVFKRIVRDAYDAYVDAVDGSSKQEPPHYVLIVDEINRGDLAQIFGEVITLLEADKRLDEPEEIRVELPYSGEPFVIPPNLYIIGTMNTADRSIALVDAALRRRFDFISMPPKYDLLRDHYSFTSKEEVQTVATTTVDPFCAGIALSILLLEHLNERIINTPDIGKGKQIGHAYLLGLTTPRELVHTWANDILPLLEEYYFGQLGQLKSELFRGHGDRLVNWDREEIQQFDLEDLIVEFGSILDLHPERAAKVAASTDDLTPFLETDLISDGDRLRLNEAYIPEEAFESSDDDLWTATVETDGDSTIRWAYDGGTYQPYALVREIIDEVGGAPAKIDGGECWIASETNQTLAEVWQDYADQDSTEEEKEGPEQS